MDGAGNLYGTTVHGGCLLGGMAFKINPSGKLTVLHCFGGPGDGEYPYAGLVMDALGNLYGTTTRGGVSNYGTVFKIDSSGNESLLYQFFDESDGSDPRAGLVLDGGGNLSGTASVSTGGGTVFRITSSGAFSVLYGFTGGNDGRNPRGRLVEDTAGNLYGVTVDGGTAGQGMVFKISPSGTETVLHNFTGGSDGGNLYGGLVLDTAGNLYGTTTESSPGNGTVFKLDPSGKLTTLHAFSMTNDGYYPRGNLISDGAGNLYGTTVFGGTAGQGTVYKVDTSGRETVLYNFTGGKDGGNPYAGLTLDSAGANLYGTTVGGGSGFSGTVFKLSLH
jgi:uncharacterized repeat protein (TIGR03803 family)